jgi:antitoxin (DNA-binding transcriptional repressor) of toxin-antitoxin stability system
MRIELDLGLGSDYLVPMRRVNLKYAKDHLERLVDEAIAGEDVVITGEGTRPVRLLPLGEEQRASTTGPRRAKIDALLSQARSLPDLDGRSADEILGYDERGLNGLVRGGIQQG